MAKRATTGRTEEIPASISAKWYFIMNTDPVAEMYLFSQFQLFIFSLTCLSWPLYTTPMYRSYAV